MCAGLRGRIEVIMYESKCGQYKGTRKVVTEENQEGH